MASARLFVALDLPGESRAQLARWREETLGGRPELRLPAAETLHVTLVFIGHRSEEEVPAIAAAVGESADALPAALLRAAGVVAIPRRGSPRLFALDLEDVGGRGAAIQAAVSAALEPWYEPEKRPFWPHVTLARVRKGERTRLPELEPPDLGEMEASEVTLYRSRLSPRGAAYEPVERVALPGAAGRGPRAAG